MVDPLTLGLVGAGLWGLWKSHANNRKKAAQSVLREWDRRLAKFEGAPGKQLPRKSQEDYDALLEALKVLKGDRCCFSGQGECSNDFVIGHVVPLKDNGTNFSSNLRLVCTRHVRRVPRR